MKRLMLALIITVLFIPGTGQSRPTEDYKKGNGYLRLQMPSSDEQRNRNWLPDPERVVHYVRPSEADPAIARFLRDNIALFRRDLVTPTSPLVAYLPGTFGAPDRSKMMLGTIAGQGYRVIGLMYNDAPSTGVTCNRNPDPTCAGRFRAKRAFGDPVTTDHDDSAHETVTARLAATLRYLEAHHPGEGWGGYLDAKGQLAWQRIVVAGHSQGAGLAAFIAKRFEVARVVMFSSPWDYYHAMVDGQDQRLVSGWVGQPSATPPDRWYGLFHASEPNARQILAAYKALQVPPSHIRVVKLPPRGGVKDNDDYHASVSVDHSTPMNERGLPAYLDDWRFVFGAAQDFEQIR